MMTLAAPDTDPSDDRLDLVFKALSDRTRRHMLARLSQGSATVSELAAPFDMTLPAASKHLRVLEKADLIKRTKSGRVQTCTFRPSGMADADHWLTHYRAFWDDRLDALKDYLEGKEGTRNDQPDT